MIGNNTGFRCPQCGVAASWEVDECSTCGYRSEAMEGWERERKRQARRDDADGCLWGWWHPFWIVDGIELLFWGGRGLVVLLRGLLHL